MDINFDVPVQGAGAQIQPNSYGTFLATLDVYAADDTTLLVSFSEVGTSTSAGDNTAICLGALDTTPTIGRIVYSVVVGELIPDDFAINQLDLVTAAAVPEPGTLLLLGSGLAGLGAFGRRIRQRV